MARPFHHSQPRTGGQWQQRPTLPARCARQYRIAHGCPPTETLAADAPQQRSLSRYHIKQKYLPAGKPVLGLFLHNIPMRDVLITKIPLSTYFTPFLASLSIASSRLPGSLVSFPNSQNMMPPNCLSMAYRVFRATETVSS